jgi:two-component system phosphate regulon response regulator PhoB
MANVAAGASNVAGDILVIEDDPDVRRYVRERLVAAGHTVSEASTGERGVEMAAAHRFDLVLLDVELPGIDGFAALRSIRSASAVPVIMLTGAADEADRVLGLEIGADDYVVKPFMPRELVARVAAHLRRARPSDAVPPMTFGALTVDPQARTVHLDGRSVALTGREFDLLVFLASSPRRTYTREQLLVQVWNSEPGWQNVATVTEHIHRLRRRLESDPDAPRRIVTVRGTGYRFDP